MEKFTPEKQLRSHVAELLGRKQWSRADVIEVVRLTRLIIENYHLAQVRKSKVRTFVIIKLGATPAAFIGLVDAPDAATAISRLTCPISSDHG
jgi:hypothetical protein